MKRQEKEENKEEKAGWQAEVEDEISLGESEKEEDM